MENKLGARLGVPSLKTELLGIVDYSIHNPVNHFTDMYIIRRIYARLIGRVHRGYVITANSV